MARKNRMQNRDLERARAAAAVAAEARDTTAIAASPSEAPTPIVTGSAPQAEQAASSAPADKAAQTRANKPDDGRAPISIRLPKAFRDYARTAMVWDKDHDPAKPTTMNEWVEAAIGHYLDLDEPQRAKDLAAAHQDLDEYLDGGDVARALYRVDPAVRHQLEQHIEDADPSFDAGTRKRFPIAQPVTDAMLLAMHATYTASDKTLEPHPFESHQRERTVSSYGVSIMATPAFMDLVRGAYHVALTQADPPTGFANWVDRVVRRATDSDFSRVERKARPVMDEENVRKSEHAKHNRGVRLQPRRLHLSESTHALMLVAVKQLNTGPTQAEKRVTRGSYVMNALAAEMIRVSDLNHGLPIIPVPANAVITDPAD